MDLPLTVMITVIASQCSCLSAVSLSIDPLLDIHIASVYALGGVSTALPSVDQTVIERTEIPGSCPAMIASLISVELFST